MFPLIEYMLNILSWFFILFWLSMVYRFRYHGYKVLASIRWSVCTNQIICIRRLKVTGDKSKYCCLWRQPCLQCTTITIWLKKTDQNKKFLWLAHSLLRTTNIFSRNYHTKISIYRESEQHYPCTSATVLDIQRINS